VGAGRAHLLFKFSPIHFDKTGLLPLSATQKAAHSGAAFKSLLTYLIL